MNIQKRHLEAVQAVLRCLSEIDGLDGPHALIILEDAAVAVHLGMTLDLPLPRAVELASECLDVALDLD